MRSSWRLLLSRNYPRPFSKFQSSAPHFHTHSSSPTLPSPHAISRALPASRIARSFSSDQGSEPVKETDPHLVISYAFSKNTELADVDKELERHGVVVTPELVLSFLKFPDVKPDSARRFFGWILENHGEKVSCKGYNLMLGMLGANGFREEFWGLFEVMKGKGYGISRVTRDRAMARFEKDGLVGDVERLKGVFLSGSVDKSVQKVGVIVSRIVRNRVWGDDVEKAIRDMEVEFSSDLVEVVLENLAMEPMKGLIFFRWVEEMVKHDAKSYNAMAKVLGRADCIDRFWKVVEEMRSNGYEMDVETYSKVLDRFVKRKMLKDVVDLTEFAMAGANKPSVHCCTFLLKKIASAKELDMELFSRVVKIFIGSGCVLTDSMLNSVLKSLTSVGRYGECNKVLVEMKEGGMIPSANTQSKIAFVLSCNGMKDETTEFVHQLEASSANLDDKAWVSFIEGHCISGDLEKASDCFEKLVGRSPTSNDTSYAFDYLMNAYCCKNQALDACKLLCDCVEKHQFKPWQKSYRVLIKKLLAQNGFNEVLKLLELMRKQEYPPFMGPVLEYVSKYGTEDDAIAFLEAMTSKSFPSTSVVLRTFRAFFRAGRPDKAQDLLSKCPSGVRNHADILNLFASMESKKDASLVAAA